MYWPVGYKIGVCDSASAGLCFKMNLTTLQPNSKDSRTLISWLSMHSDLHLAVVKYIWETNRMKQLHWG